MAQHVNILFDSWSLHTKAFVNPALLWLKGNQRQGKQPEACRPASLQQTATESTEILHCQEVHTFNPGRGSLCPTQPGPHLNSLILKEGRNWERAPESWPLYTSLPLCSHAISPLHICVPPISINQLCIVSLFGVYPTPFVLARSMLTWNKLESFRKRDFPLRKCLHVIGL